MKHAFYDDFDFFHVYIYAKQVMKLSNSTNSEHTESI